MALCTKDADDRVVTPFHFFGSECIEFVLSADGVLSDQGRTYSATGSATIRCGFLADVFEMYATPLTHLFDVSYAHGVFFIEQVTEATLENAVARLVNVVVLFYDMMVGACRGQRGEEELWEDEE